MTPSVLAESSCEELSGNMQHYSSKAATRESDAQLVAKFHSCNQLGILFRGRYSIRHLGPALSALDSSGEGAFDVLLDYMSTAEGRSFSQGDEGVYRAKSVKHWLVQKKDPSKCAPLYEHFDKVSSKNDYYRNTAQSYFLETFYHLGCEEEAVGVAEKFLVSSVVSNRMRACDVYAKYGLKTDIKKVGVLAYTDQYMENYQHPVRRSCTTAIGKIRIRAEATSSAARTR